jgi:hypothetical protein
MKSGDTIVAKAGALANVIVVAEEVSAGEPSVPAALLYLSLVKSSPYKVKIPFAESHDTSTGVPLGKTGSPLAASIRAISGEVASLPVFW